MYALKIRTRPYGQYYWLLDDKKLTPEGRPEKIPENIKTFDTCKESAKWIEQYSHTVKDYDGHYYNIEVIPQYKKVLVKYELGHNHVQE